MRVQRTSKDLNLRFDSDTAHLREVRVAVEAFCREIGFTDRVVGEIGLVVNEAIANVIRHAYDSQPGHPIELSARATESDVTIEIRDWSSGKIPPKFDQMKRRKPREVPEPGGLGLMCIKTVMDQAEFAPQTDGMILRMIKRK